MLCQLNKMTLIWATSGEKFGALSFKYKMEINFMESNYW
jgi:hypothetical protein